MRLRSILAVPLLLTLAASTSMASFLESADYMPMPPARPHIRTPDAHLSKGKFLVAAPSMADPRFSGTIVLIIDYGTRGAVGLVVNRPTGIKLSAAFTDVKGFEKRDGALYLGGPVETGQVFILLRSGKEVAESSRVFKDVYVSSSESVLERAANGGVEFRVFAGFAGWAPLQLDREVSLGVWRVIDADGDVIFSGKPLSPEKPGGP